MLRLYCVKGDGFMVVSNLLAHFAVNSGLQRN